MDRGTGSSAITSTTAAFRTRQREWLAWIAAVVAMLAVIALVVGMFRQAVPELHVTRLDIVTPQTSNPFAFALAPDGRQLVFAVTEETGARLWRRRLDEQPRSRCPEPKERVRRSGPLTAVPSGSSLTAI